LHQNSEEMVIINVAGSGIQQWSCEEPVRQGESFSEDVAHMCMRRVAGRR